MPSVWAQTSNQSRERKWFLGLALLMLPDLNRVRVFFHVHQAGSIRQAATMLGVTQSAVSQSLAKLEEELGVALFVRQHRRLVRTSEGMRLFEVVAPFIESLSSVLPNLDRKPGDLVGTLRVGAPSELGATRLPSVFAAFRSSHPDVGFALRLGHPSVLVPALAAGELDLAFVDEFDVPTRRAGGVGAHGVLQEALVLAGVPELVAQVKAGSDRFARLRAATFVAYHVRAPSVASWFQHHLGKVPGRVRASLVVESVQTVVSALRAGLGLGVVPEDSIAGDVERGALSVVRTRRRPLTNTIALLRLLDKRPSPIEHQFVSALGSSLSGYEVERAG